MPDGPRGAGGWPVRGNGVGERKQVTIHTDGACAGNPGPGGYGVVLRYRDKVRELTGGARLTTNNRMEVLAAVVGLEALTERCAVTLHSDSRYLVDAMSKGWAARWRANGWLLGKRAPARNADLWARLLDLCAVHDVTFVWVKGHAGEPDNEHCDALAERAARQPDLPADTGYEDAKLAPPLSRADGPPPESDPDPYVAYQPAPPFDHAEGPAAGQSGNDRVRQVGDPASVEATSPPVADNGGHRASPGRRTPARKAETLAAMIVRQHGALLADVLTQLWRRRWQPIRWAAVKVFDRPGVYALGLGVPTRQGAAVVYIGPSSSLPTRLMQHAVSFENLPAAGFGPTYTVTP